MVRRLFPCSVLYRFAYSAGLLALATLLLIPRISAQTESATVLGRVTDNTGAVLKGVEIEIRNIDTNVATTSSTSAEGLYAIHSLPPGRYIVSVHKQGFKTVSLTGLKLNVQDNLIRNFTLQIGAVSESITVNAESAKINTTDATVSTVIDRNFAENLPMNGRSFQTLVELTPGVVAVPTNVEDQGQFSVNGQRASSNYWSVDGVSANIGTGVASQGNNGNGMAGSIGSFSALGGTNSLVSVDAMQEFRIQTSTYAPEFGRTPGAQISIATRAGTNQFHGTAFDYFRNEALDASNWFNGATTPSQPKARERQNDFGGTFGGPIYKDRTFFFFSYEGLRLRLPETVISNVPDVAARQNADPAMLPFLNAYPLPNGVDNVSTGVAQFNSSFSSSATLDAASLRIDQKLNDKINLFARYNYSPSDILQRGGGVLSPSVLTPIRITTATETFGVSSSISPRIVNDLRFNYSRTNATSHSFLDDFGGAVPLRSLPFPSPFTDQNGQLRFQIFSLRAGLLTDGFSTRNLQRQINLVDSLSLQQGSHNLKFGIDFRRLSPFQEPDQYSQTALFGSVTTAETGNALAAVVNSSTATSLLFRNFSAFAQDMWRATPRLSLTYGLRWDVDFSPSSLDGPKLPAVTGFNLNDLSKLSIAPAGTPPFKTSYGNIAPRLGVAYQMRQTQSWQTVLRGGGGLFYDLATVEVGGLVSSAPPFGNFAVLAGPAATFPLAPASSAPPLIPSSATLSTIVALDPNLKQPYTWQWNVALEQELGKEQTISMSYIGAAGRRLLRSATASFPASNPNIQSGSFVDNSATSDYDALQVQFHRHLSQGLQIQSSYTWSHSIDTGSASSVQVSSNLGGPGTNADRGPSDFDIRHAFSVGATYDIPAPVQNAFLKSILHGWSMQHAFQMHSAPPVDVFDGIFTELSNGFLLDVRPDLVPGQPLYLHGSNCASVMQTLGSLAPGQTCPGGKAINPQAFTDPPFDPTTFALLRQGNVPRNFLRGFGVTQWDAAVHRMFTVHEPLQLEFRAELFNVLNHPNFAQPIGTFFSPAFGGAATSGFGLSNQTLNQSLSGSGNAGTGGFNALYQIGGPRSIQLALKLIF